MKLDARAWAARVENLPAVTAFVEACADRAGLDGRARFGLRIALEEAFVNVSRYAYPGGGGIVEVSCESDAEAFVLEIADRGEPFDVLSLPEPDTTSDVAHRPVGGLGVHFIRKFSSRVAYRRDDGRNVLRMTFLR